jgi:hypothetical protein
VDQSRAATRITIRPYDPSTGEEVEKKDVVKGYKCSQFVTFMAGELKALNVESSRVIVKGGGFPQATTRSGTRTLPLVSGPSSKATTKLAAPTQVPTSHKGHLRRTPGEAFFISLGGGFPG